LGGFLSRQKQLFLGEALGKVVKVEPKHWSAAASYTRLQKAG
jgi:hypothetical protein